MSTPTSRTLEKCRKLGFQAAVVEKWIPQTKRRIDVFGFGDLLVVDDKPGALLIQATGDNAGDVARRVEKIKRESPRRARRWLAAGNRIQVWGWGKRGAAGARKLWTLRIVDVLLGDLPCPCQGEETDPGPHIPACPFNDPNYDDGDVGGAF